MELWIIIAIVALLAAIFLAALAKAKRSSSRIGCINNVKQICLAFRAWAIDNDIWLPMQVSVTSGGTMELKESGFVYPHFQIMSNQLTRPELLVCPNDVKRVSATNFFDLTDKNLSYFVSIDAIDGDGSSLLCGDRNITNRPNAGSRLVSLAKGSAVAWNKEIHVEKGYLGFGDGSVNLFDTARVGVAFKVGDVKTNRLAVP